MISILGLLSGRQKTALSILDKAAGLAIIRIDRALPISGSALCQLNSEAIETVTWPSGGFCFSQ